MRLRLLRHIAFSPYDWARDDDRREFRRVLRYFLSQLPVRVAADANEDEDFRRFFIGSLGLVGLLKEWLERALGDCLADGRTSITRDDLLAAAMPKGKLLKIAQENEQGEIELRLMNEDKHDEIERLLGMQRPKKPAPTARPKLLPGTASRSVILWMLRRPEVWSLTWLRSLETRL